MYLNLVSAMRRAIRLAGLPYTLMNPPMAGALLPRMRPSPGLSASAIATLPALRRKIGPAAQNDDAPFARMEGQTVRRIFEDLEGTRRYELFVPISGTPRPKGLVVMLHGCKQDAADFAAGTAMNAVAERHGLAVAYPIQERNANASSCWNWFSPLHQGRDRGEPALIAGITRQVVEEFDIDRDQVFVAGLSAGGAMAAILSRTHPDLFAGIGIHSGLCYGCAKGAMSAMAAMRSVGPSGRERRTASQLGRPVRTIIFHGTADRTVTPGNGDQVFRDACSDIVGRVKPGVTSSVNGRNCRRTVIENGDGRSLTEYWQIEGGGHAWSGGQTRGSFTDARGPDASAEIIRFFLADVGRPSTDRAVPES